MGKRGLAAAAVGALCIAATLASAGAATAAHGGYHTDGLGIVDGQGRQLFLRGVDVSGAEYTATNQALPYTASDFVAIRRMGADVVRIPIGWALIEPTRGHFDTAALARVHQIVGWAAAAGLHIVLDMHQYEWTACFGGLGIPRWAVPNCPATPPGNVVGQEADILTAENALWHSPALQAEFAAAWVKAAKAAGDPAGLLGYDLFNEPGPGYIPNEVFEQDYLAPFYRQVGTALRAINPGALLFVEASILNGLVNGSSQFLGPIGLDNVVYEPHQYGAVSFNGDTSVLGAVDVAGPAQFLPDLELDVAVAQRMHAALWLGEWGAINKVGSIRPINYVADDLAAQDQLLMGSAYWSSDSVLPGVLPRVSPEAIAGRLVHLATGVSALDMTWLAGPGTTTVDAPHSCVPSVRVLQGHATWTVGAGTVALRATVPDERLDVVVSCLSR